MTFTDYNAIPYPYLHDAGYILSRRYNLESIYMDKRGELSITFKGKLSENAVKDILQNITPNDICKDDIALEYNLSHSYSDDMQKTYVYSPDGIDYREL